MELAGSSIACAWEQIPEVMLRHTLHLKDFLKCTV